jgi:hypothetical protein
MSEGYRDDGPTTARVKQRISSKAYSGDYGVEMVVAQLLFLAREVDELRELLATHMHGHDWAGPTFPPQDRRKYTHVAGGGRL